MKPFVAVMLAISLCACGGASKQVEPAPKAPVPEPVAEDEPPPRPTYVIVHRNTPIHLAPSEEAPFLQYRDDARQKELEERWAERFGEEDAAWLESHEEWWEKEKERREKLRKRLRKVRASKRADVRERDLERQDARVDAHYVKRLDQLRDRAREQWLEAPDRAWIPFRVARSKGDWLGLSPVDAGVEPHCYSGNFGALDRLEATFWVKRRDVEKVTTRAVTVQPMDGTSVTLKPGVALRPSGSRYKVFVGAFELELDVPSEAIGTEYEPAEFFEAPVTNMVFTPYSQARDRLQLGPRQILPYNPYRQLYITKTVGVGSRFYATTQTQCGEYTVRLSKDYIEPAGKRGVMRLSGDDNSVKPPYARSGAMAHLPDGEPFARVRRDFPLGEEIEGEGGRLCYRSAVWGRSTKPSPRTVSLCFVASDVVRD